MPGNVGALWEQGSDCGGSLMALGQGNGVNGVMGRAAQKQESILSTGSSSLGGPVLELPVPKPSSRCTSAVGGEGWG